MKFKRSYAIVGAGLALAAALSLSANVAFAEGPALTKLAEATGEADATAQLTKEFQFPKGIDVPSQTFSFNATAVTADAPTLTIANLAFDKSDTKVTTDSAVNSVSKTQNLVFGEFTKAGLYEYTIAETDGKQQNVRYDTTQYTLRVYVENKAGDKGGVYIKLMTLTKKNENTKLDSSAFKFTNTYNPGTSSLKISKALSDGDTSQFADRTKQFTFKLTLTKPSTDTTTGDVSGNIVSTYNTANNATVSDIKTDGTEKTFTLRDGEELTIENLPVGTVYTVVEDAAEGYTPKVQVTEGGTQLDPKRGTVNTNLAAAPDTRTGAGADTSLNGKLVVKSGDNKVAYTNSFTQITPMGIVLNNLPFVMLIVVAAGGLVTLSVLKQKKTTV